MVEGWEGSFDRIYTYSVKVAHDDEIHFGVTAFKLVYAG